MRYMFLTSGAETGLVPPQRMIDAIEGLTEREMAAGRMIARGGLMPTAMGSARLESRRGKLKLTDGPFAETKEQVGGYYLVDCKDLDEAIEVASKIPGARHGTIEVRPIWEM